MTNILTLSTSGTSAMAAQRQGHHFVYVSDRLQARLDVIGDWLRQQTFSPEGMTRLTFTRGTQYALPAVTHPPVAYWAKRIEQKEVSSLDDLRGYALEYVRLNSVDPVQRQLIWLNEARRSEFDRSLDIIRGYLTPYADRIPILGRKSKAQTTPSPPLMIVMAIVKMADDIQHHPERLS